MHRTLFERLLPASRPKNSQERSGVAAGGGGGSGGSPQATEYKGQQGIVNILNKKKTDCLPSVHFTITFYLVVLTVLLLYYSIFKQNKFQ
jgi:hypothetical protein